MGLDWSEAPCLSPASLTALVRQTWAAARRTVAVVSVSGEAVGAFAGELKAFAGSTRSINVAAVSAGETWVLLGKSACRKKKEKKQKKRGERKFETICTVHQVSILIFLSSASRGNIDPLKV